MPLAVNGVDTNLLNPKKTWADDGSYEDTLKQVVSEFEENFKKFDVGDEIVKAGPGF